MENSMSFACCCRFCAAITSLKNVDSNTYTGTTSALLMPTGNSVIDALIVGSKWGTGPKGTGASVTFSFPDALADFDTRFDVPGNYNETEPTAGGYSNYVQALAPFSIEARMATLAVLSGWAAVADIRFTQVPANGIDDGMLRFAMSGPPGLGETTYGVSAFPQDFAAAGDTWMNSNFLFPEGWAAGTQNFLTLMHEAGHAIGLKHPHDTGMDGQPGWPATPAVLEKQGDDTLINFSTQDTVMAYNDLPGIGSPVQADFAPTTPMRIDILAIQAIYGANNTHASGDTTHTFQSDLPYNQTLWDADGIDTIIVEGPRSIVINLKGGTWSNIGLPITYSERGNELQVVKSRPDLTNPNNVFIFDTVVIENATGGGGDDLLLGNAVANRLDGRGGNDSIDGGAGIDTVIYGGGVGQYSLRIDRPTRTASVSDSQSGRDGRDILVDVEKVQFGTQTFDLFNPPRTETPRFGESKTVLFDASYYLLSNPELVPSVSLQSAAQHYLDQGAGQGRQPNTWFDPVYYADRWGDLRVLNLAPDILFLHYNLYGVWEGRSAGPTFDRYDGNRYLTDNPDVAAYVDAFVGDFLGSRTNGAIAHYVIYGANEGRVPYDFDGNRLESAVLIGVAGV